MSSASTAEARERVGGPLVTTGQTLVVGLGNPVRGDDAVGWRVVEALEARLAATLPAGVPAPDVERLAVGGLTLMEHLVGYGRAILVDALEEGLALGTVTWRPFEKLPSGQAAHLDSSHDAGLAAALAAGRALGAPLPPEIIVVGVEVRDSVVFAETLSPAVEAAIPAAVETVLTLLMAA